eukprot:ANDGO_04244.mRNA.1 hypothetical protein
MSSSDMRQKQMPNYANVGAPTKTFDRSNATPKRRKSSRQSSLPSSSSSSSSSSSATVSSGSFPVPTPPSASSTSTGPSSSAASLSVMLANTLPQIGTPASPASRMSLPVSLHSPSIPPPHSPGTRQQLIYSSAQAIQGFANNSHSAFSVHSHHPPTTASSFGPSGTGSSSSSSSNSSSSSIMHSGIPPSPFTSLTMNGLIESRPHVITEYVSADLVLMSRRFVAEDMKNLMTEAEHRVAVENFKKLRRGERPTVLTLGDGGSEKPGSPSAALLADEESDLLAEDSSLSLSKQGTVHLSNEAAYVALVGEGAGILEYLCGKAKRRRMGTASS